MDSFNQNENQNQNFHQNPDTNQPNYEKMDSTPSGMATAALVIGILSIVTLCCSPLSVILGALGIIFSLLSRKGKARLQGNAMSGLVISVIGIILGILVTIGYIFYTIRMMGSEDFRQYLNEYEDIYGEDYYKYNYDNFYDNLYEDIENSL